MWKKCADSFGSTHEWTDRISLSIQSLIHPINVPHRFLSSRWWLWLHPHSSVETTTQSRIKESFQCVCKSNTEHGSVLCIFFKLFCFFLCDFTGTNSLQRTQSPSATDNSIKNKKKLLSMIKNTFQRQTASYLTQTKDIHYLLVNCFLCIVPWDVLKSGGINIGPGKKRWGPVPPANYAYVPNHWKVWGR